MSSRTSSLLARAKSFSRTLWALPAFVILSLIPWLLATHAFALSRQFSEGGRDLLGVSFKIAAIIIAACTAFATLWFLVIWIAMLVRCIRGAETR
jgi:hypothetical protein